MRSWLFRFLIKRLLGELSLPNIPEREDQQMNDWLAGAWMSPGFRKYISHRDSKIIYELAGGAGLTPDPNYTMKFGQRVEILLLGKMAKEAHERKEKAQSLANKESLPTTGKITS